MRSLRAFVLARIVRLLSFPSSQAWWLEKKRYYYTHTVLMCSYTMLFFSLPSLLQFSLHYLEVLLNTSFFYLHTIFFPLFSTTTYQLCVSFLLCNSTYATLEEEHEWRNAPKRGKKERKKPHNVSSVLLYLVFKSICPEQRKD